MKTLLKFHVCNFYEKNGFIISGIGYETALSFARRKGRVILACRSKERAEAACKTMKETTGNQNVFVKIIDLSIMASVRKFAEDFTKEEKRLDILVNNAAVSGMSYV